ncbi:MAG: hypothetical protein KAR08_10535 [Candidatus Heimdallarchaeota archaeon]|nr:hypothetical protein [Candidatus Heimdallarchaeota archaeon]
MTLDKIELDLTDLYTEVKSSAYSNTGNEEVDKEIAELRKQFKKILTTIEKINGE